MAQTIQNPFDVIFGYLEEHKEKLAGIEYQLSKLNLNKEAAKLPGDNLTIDDAVVLAAQNATPIKRSEMYKHTMLAGQGKSDFPVEYFGKRVVIPRKLFLEWLKIHTKKPKSIDEENTQQLAKAANRKLKYSKGAT